MLSSTASDNLACTDEVKVYEDEGEEEEQQKSSENLTEDKVRLVIESETQIPKIFDLFGKNGGASSLFKMPFPTDPRLASYFLPGYPAAIAAAMAAVNAASYSLSSSPCLTTCSSSTSSSLPSMTKPTSSIWNMNPAAVVAAAAAAGTASSFWSTGCSGGGGSSSTSSGYASSEGSGGSNGTNGSNWLHHSAISPGSNSSIGGSGGSGGGSCGSGFSFLQYPYPRQHNLFNQKHYLRTSNDDDLISCIRRESPSFDRSVYFSNNNINNNNTNFPYAENHPIDYNLSGQISRFSNLYNDPVKNSASLKIMCN